MSLATIPLAHPSSLAFLLNPLCLVIFLCCCALPTQAVLDHPNSPLASSILNPPENPPDSAAEGPSDGSTSGAVSSISDGVSVANGASDSSGSTQSPSALALQAGASDSSAAVATEASSQPSDGAHDATAEGEIISPSSATTKSASASAKSSEPQYAARSLESLADWSLPAGLVRAARTWENSPLGRRPG